MAEQIKVNGDFEYTANVPLKLIGEEPYDEPGSGYKAPPDTVRKYTFQAHSKHGLFVVQVEARRAGFDTEFVIEEPVCIECPEGISDYTLPSFELELIDDEDPNDPFIDPIDED